MIDEFLEEKIDRICAFVPRYFGPRMVRFCSNPVGWRLYLYASAARRSVVGTFVSIKTMNARMMEEDLRQLQEEEIDPQYADLDPEKAREYTRLDREQQERNKEMEKTRRKMKSPVTRLKEWWAGRHERGAARDMRWAAREAAAIAKAQERLSKAGPLMLAMSRSRFPSMLLMTMLSVLGVCAVGGGDMAYAAASCCLMWLATAFETGYAPVCGAVRQRYLAVLLLRAASSLALLPMFFFGYIGQGVRYNVLLQSAMLVLLFTHAVFYLALVAFNTYQKALARVLSGLLGVIPALTAASAIALAATQLAQPMPLPAAGVLSAVGAVLAFAADRLTMITELGGIRLRYTPIWITVFMETGYSLMLLGAWMAA